MAMAIYHLQCSHGSRQGGQSALAKAMYVLRRGKYARGRDDLEESDSGHLPEWCTDPLSLFAAADRFERANARLFVELEAALPAELNLEQCIALTRAMADLVAAGLPFVWGIHAGRPTAPGAPRNAHWHILFLERINDNVPRGPELWFRRANRRDPAAGGAPKDRSLKGHQWLPNVRRQYEQLVNKALERAGRPDRVTADSHRTRIARADAAGDHETAAYLRRHPPGLHVGPTACAIERGRAGRPGRPTERGDLARARDAEAARLRAESEGIDHELQEHVRAAVAAARDAGVDEESVAAAQSSDPDTVIALDDATESRRRDIRAFAAAVGFDDDVIDDVRGMAAPDNPELGWTDVVEWIEAHVAVQVNRARRLGLPVGLDAIFADARRRGAKPVPHLVRVTQIWAEARRAGLDNRSLNIIFTTANLREVCTEWSAIEDATAKRVERKEGAELDARAVGVDARTVYAAAEALAVDPVDALERAVDAAEERIEAVQEREKRQENAAETAARNLGVDVEAAYAEAWERNEDGFDYLERATAARRERKDAAETAARNLGVDVEAAYAEARAGNEDGVDYLERATAARRERKDAAETAARRIGVDVEAVCAEARAGNEDEVAHLKRATAAQRRRKAAAETAARRIGVDVEAVCAEARAGNEDEVAHLKRATAERRRRKAAETAARRIGVDVEAVCAEARAGNEDEVAHLKRATAERRRRKKVAETAARNLGVDVEAAYAEARAGNEDEVGYLERATTERGKRKEVAEEAARKHGLNVDVIYAGTPRDGTDAVEHLERATTIWDRARRAGFDIEQLNDIYRRAEEHQTGTGPTAIENATVERGNKRKAVAEEAARELGLNVDVFYAGTPRDGTDPVEHLERATTIWDRARRAGFDIEQLNDIYRRAEEHQTGTGPTAIENATVERGNKRKAVAEEAARRLGLNVDVFYAGTPRDGTDPVEHLERATTIWDRARRAGFGIEQLNDIFLRAEEHQTGTGPTAIENATVERGNKRKAVAEEAARRLGLNVDVFYAGTPRDGTDPVEHLERATTIWDRARRAGFGIEQLNDIYRRAEEQQTGTGPTAIENATVERGKRKAVAEEAARELGLNVDVFYAGTPRDGTDPVEHLERATTIWDRARRAGFGIEQLNDIYRRAEEQQTGTGPTAIENAIVERGKRKAVAEEAARELGLNVDVFYAGTPRDGTDPVEHLERATTIWDRARRAGFGIEQLNDIYRRAEEQQTGTGPTAIEVATAERAKSKAAGETAARNPGVDLTTTHSKAREPNEDEVDYREQAISERRKREEQQQQQQQLADLTADVRATTSGAERLDKMRRARLDATKRSLTLDEEMFVVQEVKLQIEADLARRAVAVEASPRGGELLRSGERRHGGPPQSLAEREETIEAIELRGQAADAAVASLTAMAPDPERPDRRVPPVLDAVLDAVPAVGDDPFLGDVVWLVQAQFAQAEQKGVEASGYDAEERETSARRHFGSVLESPSEWCVLTVRALLLAACHKILGGRGDTGARVQASLKAADVERQSHQRAAHEAARTVAIDPNAFSEAARADGRNEVAAIVAETARRRQVFSVAVANDIDVRAVFDAHEAQAAGSGIPAIEAAIQRRQEAVAAARRLGVDVDAVCTAPRSKREDPVQALQEETARRTKVLLFSDFIGLSDRQFEDIFRAAEEQRRDSGYTAIRNECIRRQAHELVRKELPFGHSRPAQQGTWALAVSAEPRRDLLRGIEDDPFVHSTLTDVLAASPGSAEERQGAERCYHRPEIELKLQKLKAQRRWYSSKPTQDDALQAVLEQFIPELADRLCAACDGVADLDRLVARVVEDDWMRRVVDALPQALPRAWPHPGIGSWSTAASNERLNRSAAATDDHRVKKVIVAFQARHDSDADDRQRAENVLLEHRRREGEKSGQNREQADAAARREHDAELLRILQELCRQVQSRDFEEICRERARMRKPSPVHPAIPHNHREKARNRPDHSQGWSR